uniref:Uncharacterized protein n=1 Tax=Arion vulgaris TaxID=1028688 RepID=A0A0B7B6P9_9EUPU
MTSSLSADMSYYLPKVLHTQHKLCSSSNNPKNLMKKLHMKLGSDSNPQPSERQANILTIDTPIFYIQQQS